MNRITVFGFIAVSFIISSAIVAGAPIDTLDIGFDTGAFTPVVSDFNVTSPLTTVINSTTTYRPTTTSITEAPASNSSSKPSGSNGGFQIVNPLNGFQGINWYSSVLRLLISPTINHYKEILKNLQMDPEYSNIAVSVQKTIDSFEQLMAAAPNLEKAENASRDIQARNFIKSLTQPFSSLFNATKRLK